MSERITSPKNEKIRNLILLQKRKKTRDEQERFVTEGLRIFEDALRSAPDYIDQIYLSDSFSESGAWKEISRRMDTSSGSSRALGGSLSKRVTIVSDDVFGRISETVTPQGILCVMRMRRYEYAQMDRSRLLLLENIQDPGNLGTMIRTAEAAGMTGIIMSRDTADIYSPKVTRSTMGSIFRMPLLYTDDICEMTDRLVKDGVTVYGAYLKDGIPYTSVSFKSPLAVLIGNEGNGISDSAIKKVSKKVYIPMHGQIESLNAAVAAAILMYRASDFQVFKIQKDE